MPGLVTVYRKVIKTLPIETCRRFARKTRDYIRAYMDGAAENEIDYLVSTKYKSHRCVFDSDLNKLVLNSGRKLIDLEVARAQKTKRAQELKVVRKAPHGKKQTPTSNNGHLDNIIRLTAAQQAANGEE